MSAPAPPLALYLHFPWCVQKCPYCDFNSHAARGDIPEEAYVSALIRDLEAELGDEVVGPSLAGRSLASIFMGGGTPSLFSDRAIGRTLDAVRQRLPFAADIEITLEANPGTAEAGHFAGYRAAGVNRLSMGFQSLDDAQLKRLGRIHDSAEALRAYELARRAGFDNINLDMMFALPSQTVDAALRDLSGLIGLGSEHLSWYQLTLEQNTEFGVRPPPAMPDDDVAWAMQEQGQALLADAGFAQYEVSAYARAGRQARHNRNYWEFGDYLGIGAGAHGKLTVAGADLQILRRARHKHPRAYQEHAGTPRAIQEQTRLAAIDLPFEFVLNALRLNEGFAPPLYEARTGLSWNPEAPAVAEARRLGLLDCAPDRVRPTERGRRYLNRLLTLFLAD